MSEVAREEGVLTGPSRSRPAGLTVHETRSAVRVFLLDGHPLFRNGVRSAVENIRDMRIAGEAATGKEALDALRDGTCRHPDVIVADLPSVGIPLAEFIGLAAELSGPRPVRVLIVSTADSDEAVIEAIRAGAHGFLRKSTDRDELIRAIRTVTSGGAVFGPVIAERLQRYFTKIRHDRGPEAFPELTSREREVLDLLARGHSNRDIARRLFLAEKTVRNHVSHIFAKLHVKDRSAAAARARSTGPWVGSPG
ncbi:LuxR C-terminal-related transcriptional regulator [Streptomyces sp. NBC_01187]|uniref:LuxR C-terminal-related transcriptional regulator n=1 Tax=Streptomyces sp. NBC_01187 TaxID=2903766 RepID=UPI003865B311|nr:response regulator transcription factor [Streptomyces sp. NBC_01187]